MRRVVVEALSNFLRMRRGTLSKLGLSERGALKENVRAAVNTKESKRATKRSVLSPETNSGIQERRLLSREFARKEDDEVSDVVSMPKAVPFPSSKELAMWLKSHHAAKSELWVKIYKKQSTVTSVSWDDVVVECLCWGWIDGIRKSGNDQCFIQRITPRKARSNWSKRNRCHVERLILEGRMKEPGLVHVRAAKEDGRWENAYSASESEVPEDFLAAVKGVPKAHEVFKTLNKSSRCVIAQGLLSAKKPETRERRFAKFMDMLLKS